MSASEKTKKILAFKSGGICALPGCRIELTEDDSNNDPHSIGEAAHIQGELPTSARYNPAMTDDERNHISNLIYLCRNCHKRIDDRPQDYTVTELQRHKKVHEERVIESISEGFTDVSFAELEEATEWILKIDPDYQQSDFSLISIKEKLQKNNLYTPSMHIISMGLSVAKEVKQFINETAKTDNTFPDRLKIGFLGEYLRLTREGHTGDELFDLMCKFATRGFRDQASRSAGLAVLIYLLEACEVFEK